ncbi:hypothetical protein CEK25_005139 [Fusarium fujikuroi]|nr:hypothetical protein CEK25_005139 [Fusarium fujikuroi]
MPYIILIIAYKPNKGPNKPNSYRDTFSCYYSKFTSKKAGFKSPKDSLFIYIALASFRPSPNFCNIRSNY